jgi:hypothetical protein
MKEIVKPPKRRLANKADRWQLPAENGNAFIHKGLATCNLLVSFE